MKDETDEPLEFKNVSVTGDIEARFTPEFTKTLETSQKQEHARETLRFRVEVATLVAIAIYTALAFWQGCSTQKAANAAKEAAEASSALDIAAK